MIRSRLTLAAALVFVSSCASLENQYQRDADLYRISHLIHYGELLSEYYEKANSYPFEGASEKQVQVTIATEEQTQYLEPKSDVVETYSMDEFRAELERVLGRPIELRFEPQRVPTTMPLYYLYVMEEGEYFFVIHLYHEYPFAAKRGPGFNHVEITNSEIEHAGFWRFSELLADEQFRNVARQHPERSGWFDRLESKNK